MALVETFIVRAGQYDPVLNDSTFSLFQLPVDGGEPVKLPPPDILEERGYIESVLGELGELLYFKVDGNPDYPIVSFDPVASVWASPAPGIDEIAIRGYEYEDWTYKSQRWIVENRRVYSTAQPNVEYTSFGYMTEVLGMSYDGEHVLLSQKGEEGGSTYDVWVQNIESGETVGFIARAQDHTEDAFNVFADRHLNTFLTYFDITPLDNYHGPSLEQGSIRVADRTGALIAKGPEPLTGAYDYNMAFSESGSYIMSFSDDFNDDDEDDKGQPVVQFFDVQSGAWSDVNKPASMYGMYIDEILGSGQQVQGSSGPRMFWAGFKNTEEAA